MELKKRVQVSSSWESSVHLQDILYLNNQAGNVVEAPEGSELCPSLTLSQPEGQAEAACFLHIRQLPQLSGYVVCGVELQSSSRTVEAYSEDDYIATSQGVFIEGDRERKLYHCKVTLPADCSYDQLTLKLLSLRGKTCVNVARLVLVVAEDYGGVSSEIDPAVPSKATDLQSLISSLPLQSHKSNAPPFLQGLLSSLQHLSTTPDKPAEDQPLDITQMIAAFRQLRPASSHPEETKTEATSSQEREEPKEEPAQTKETVDEDQMTSVSLVSMEAMMDQKIEELEGRLKRYIDTKMAAILKQIEIKLEQRSDVKGSEVNEGDGGLNRHMMTHNGVHLEEQLD